MREKILLVGGGIAAIPTVIGSVIVVVAVWPMLNFIGFAVIGFIFVCVICASLGVVSFTVHRIGVWHLEEIHRRNTTNLIVAGDIVVYRDDTNGLVHLSAEHERAKSMGLALLADKSVNSMGASSGIDISGNDSTIIELYQKGHTEQTIAKAVKLPWEIVHKVIETKG